MYSKREDLEAFLNSSFYKEKLQLHNKKGVGFTESKDLIVDLYQNKFIHDEELRDPIIFEKSLEDLISALNSLCEMKDCEWDFSFNDEIEGMAIVLYHKELNMAYTYYGRNDDEDIYTHKDMYTLIPLRIVGGKILFSESIKGVKMSYSAREIFSSYSHSHLSGSTIGRYGDYCTGGSDSTLINEIRSMEASEISYLSCLLEVIGLLEYESREGVPYQYVEHLASSGISHLEYVEVNTSRCNRKIPNFIDFLNIKSLNLDVDITVSANGRYIVKDTKQLEREILKVLSILNLNEELPEEEIANVLYIIAEGTTKMVVMTEGNSPRAYQLLVNDTLKDTCLMFKGNIIEVQVEELETPETSLNFRKINVEKFKVLPYFLKYVKEKLEKMYNSNSN